MDQEIIPHECPMEKFFVDFSSSFVEFFTQSIVVKKRKGLFYLFV